MPSSLPVPSSADPKEFLYSNLQRAVQIGSCVPLKDRQLEIVQHAYCGPANRTPGKKTEEASDRKPDPTLDGIDRSKPQEIDDPAAVGLPGAAVQDHFVGIENDIICPPEEGCDRP